MTTTVDKNVVLDVLEQDARREMLKYFNADSCIAATKIAVDVMNHFGFSTHAQPCTACVYNAKLTKRLDSLKWDMSKFDGKFGEGEWSVGVGYAGGRTISKAEGWAGHLVAVTYDDLTLIDLSIDQSSRPHKNISLKPLVITIPQPWITGALVFDNDDGCTLVYNKTNNLLYLTSPNWNIESDTRNITETLIAMIERKHGSSR